jgi:hypothetical protein
MFRLLQCDGIEEIEPLADTAGERSHALVHGLSADFRTIVLYLKFPSGSPWTSRGAPEFLR